MLLTREGYVTESSSSEFENDELEKQETVDCYYETGPSIDDLPPKSGLNMLVQKVQSAEITAKGQQWSVFQIECKIKEKAYKLIIDGRSFTNVISKDLVYTLGLFMWRHSQSHYMEWLYNSGRLKITHKVRVPFVVGDYVDKVDCDVVPMDACGLLVGRPWQYDHNATHEGRSNTYSFVHDGKRHVLKLMMESAIRMEKISAQKKEALKVTPKPRTTLLKGGGDDTAPKTIGRKGGVVGQGSKEDRAGARACVSWSTAHQTSVLSSCEGKEPKYVVPPLCHGKAKVRACGCGEMHGMCCLSGTTHGEHTHWTRCGSCENPRWWNRGNML